MTEPTPTRAPLPRTASFVVVGGGFAGLSTASALAARGVTDLVVLEQESVPGFHSSGRNAAILRRLIEEPTTMALGLASYDTLRTLTDDEGRSLIDETGGLLIGDEAFCQRMSALAESSALAVARLTHDEVIARVPALEGADFFGGLFVASDGVVDIHGLTQRLLAPVRRRFYPATAVTAISDASRGLVVHTSAGDIATDHLVIAAGFGSNRVAALAGLSPLPFEPVRRHLFVTSQTEVVARGTPWVWNGSAGYYFRPEGRGLLLCACDATPWRDDMPFDPPVDPAMKERLAEKLTGCVPRLSDVSPSRGWAGLRVLTPDDRFVIGRDPRHFGITWVAGLGGHGMTTALAVGQVGADAALGLDTPEALSPARFLGAA